jgi:hypothetical protein
LSIVMVFWVMRRGLRPTSYTLFLALC